jgi:hypothetical protein
MLRQAQHDHLKDVVQTSSMPAQREVLISCLFSIQSGAVRSSEGQLNCIQHPGNMLWIANLPVGFSIIGKGAFASKPSDASRSSHSLA